MEKPTKNPRWINVAYDDIKRLMAGKLRMELPEDVEIWSVREHMHLHDVGFLVKSAEFEATEKHCVIPLTSVPIEQVVSVKYGHAHSLREMARFFKGLVKEGNYPDTASRKDHLTSEYCDELIEALNVD